MNSDQLRHFELVYELHSYAAAARCVPMSAQGLTKSIRSLQKELGYELFELDETGSPVPTPYAHEFYEFVEVTASNRRLLDEAFRRVADEQGYEIRLGCSLGVMGALGPDFLDGFRVLRPDVHISYWETNDVLCDRGLTGGIYDLALAVTPIAPELEGRELFRCPVYFWVNANDPLAQKSTMTLADLSGYDVALPGEGFKCFEFLKAKTASEDIALGRVFQMSEIFQLYEFALTGRGVGFTARHHVDLSMFAQDKRVRAIVVEGMNWGFGIERLSTHALSDAEEAFWQWCVSYARTLPSDPL